MKEDKIVSITWLIFTILVLFGVFSYLNYEKKRCIENGGTIARTYGRNSGFTCIPKGSDKHE